jgi:hypothetical protein
MRAGTNSGMNHGLWLGGLGCYVLLLVGGMTHPMLGSESSMMLMTVLGLMFAGFKIEIGSRYSYKKPIRSLAFNLQDFSVYTRLLKRLGKLRRI